MSTRLSLSVGDGTSKNKCYLFTVHTWQGKEEKKKKHSWAGVMSWALWNCCLLEKSRNTKRKDGSKEGEVATGVRMDLMIPAHRHLTGGFSASLLFIITIHIHTHKHTHTQTAGWDRNCSFFFFFFFTRWSLWAILSPVALHISRAPSFIASSTAAVHYTAQSGWEILWGVDLAESILSSVSGLTLLTPPKISQLACFFLSFFHWYSIFLLRQAQCCRSCFVWPTYVSVL